MGSVSESVLFTCTMDAPGCRAKSSAERTSLICDRVSFMRMFCVTASPANPTTATTLAATAKTATGRLRRSCVAEVPVQSRQQTCRAA